MCLNVKKKNCFEKAVNGSRLRLDIIIGSFFSMFFSSFLSSVMESVFTSGNVRHKHHIRVCHSRLNIRSLCFLFYKSQNIHILITFQFNLCKTCCSYLLSECQVHVQGKKKNFEYTVKIVGVKYICDDK